VLSIFSRRSSRPGVLVGAILLLTGCALQPPTLPEVTELRNVPFFPQDAYDCGPAALATILNAAGVAVSAETLIDAVYVEGLQGSLQVELLAATRRYGLLPVPVGRDLEALVGEVASGRPVLVLQNLRLPSSPAWHYSVVVGYAADQTRFILRSGDEQSRRERAAGFARSWRLADHWGFVAVAPGEIPVSATPDTYMRAVLGAAAQLDRADEARAYRAAVAHWPNDPGVLFLAASREHARENLENAASLYRQLLSIDPDNAAGRNNLANVLLERGCIDEASREARKALELEGPDGDFAAAIGATIAEIEAAARKPAAACNLI